MFIFIKICKLLHLFIFLLLFRYKVDVNLLVNYLKNKSVKEKQSKH